MQQIAMSWLIYSLTKSPLIMGIITFAGCIPSLLISPFAGVLIDRINKFHTLILTQTIFMIGAFVLAVLTLSGTIQVWHVVVLSILLGITQSIDMPLRQTFVVELVDDPKDLSNAISLNSLVFNLARLIGPAIAGILIAAIGEGICFLLNAVSFIAVLVALFMMKVNTEPNNKNGKIDIISEFVEGYQYICSSIPIRSIILYLAATCLIGMSYPVIMPIFAKETLHGGPDTLGFLMSASGIGALLGALYLAGKKEISGLENSICISALLIAFGLIGLSLTSYVSISLMLMLFIGVGIAIIMAACNTLIQYFVDDDKRGRVMSIYTAACMGTFPIGSLIGGAIAEKVGVPHTFLLFGITMIIIVAIFSTQLKYFFAEEEVKIINLDKKAQSV